MTAETVLPPDKAIVVHGFACNVGLSIICTMEMARLVGAGFSDTDSPRVYAAARPENLWKYDGWGMPGAPNTNKKIGYHAHVAEPGEYAVKLFSTYVNGRTSNYLVADKENNRPYARFTLEAGKINYIGDFIFNEIPFVNQPRVIHAEDRPAAEAYLRDFPKMRGEWVVKPVRIEP